MAAVDVTISGMLYDKLNRTTQNVVLIGEASLTGLGVGGGPMPPGQGGGGSPPGIWGPPGPWPTPPIAFPPGWVGGQPPGGGGGQPPGGGGGQPPHPAFPIWGGPGAGFPDKPGYPPVVGGGPIMPGQEPHPEHPIVLPPEQPGQEPKWALKAVWVPQVGWVTVIVPVGDQPIPTPST